MRFTNRLLAALCCLAIGTGGIASAAPVTENVVFGNLGASGDGLISNSGSDLVAGGSQPYRAAVGFNTGTSSSQSLKLASITLGLFFDNTVSQNFTLKVYENSGGAPGSLAFTSSQTAIGPKNKYTFNFANDQMAANSTYWIVPDAGLFWYGPSPAAAPTQQNGSSYSAAGTIASTNGGSSWAATPEINFYSVSVQAVPEPSTYALAALGLGVAGIVRARRRKSTV